MIRNLSVLFFSVFLCLGLTSLMAMTPFDRMDSNSDGQLSRAEFKGRPPAFKKLDKNRDGYLTRQEVAGTRLLGGLEQTGQRKRIPSDKKSAEMIYVDTHNHLVNRRSMGQYNFEKPARIALESMDATGVKFNLLMPMPQAVNQKLRLYMEDLLPIKEKYPDRFGLLGGGGSLNVMIQQAVKEGHVTSTMEKEFDDRALELVDKGAAGFGEMTSEHFSMGEDHPYETAPPDHPLFLRLADLAAKYDLPIDLHMEAIPEKMPIPSRFQSPPNPQILKPNIEAFGRLLAHNRKAKIVWVHLGWCNTGKRTVALMRRLLEENLNLYMSIRIASGMRERRVEKATFPLDKGGRLKKEWLELFQEFSNRFIIGSDEIIKPANDHPSAGSIRSTVSVLELLPSKLRLRIGYENATRIYKLTL